MALRTRLTDAARASSTRSSRAAWRGRRRPSSSRPSATPAALGVIGAGHMPTDILREQIRDAKALTDKPFGVNLMLLTPHIDELVQLVLDEHVPFVTTGAGNPGQVHGRAAGARASRCCRVVPSVALAKRMESIGADAVIGEGMEAGGHIGELTTMVLTPQLVDAVDVPVDRRGRHRRRPRHGGGVRARRRGRADGHALHVRRPSARSTRT